MASERGIRARVWGGKSGLYCGGRQVPRRRGRAGKKSLPRQVEGNMSGWVDAKALQEDLQSLGFTPRLAKLEIGKEVERRRARS